MIRFVVPIFLFFLSFHSIASDEWEIETNKFIKKFSEQINNQKVYLSLNKYSINSSEFIPFINTLEKVIKASVNSSDSSITSQFGQHNVWLNVDYTKTAEGIFLHGLAQDAAGNQIAENNHTLKSNMLPSNWSKRELKDVAYEVSGKFDQELYGQKINAIFDGISGGQSETDNFISDFTQVLGDYMVAELTKIPSLSIKDKDADSYKLYSFKGKFKESGDEIFLTFTLTRPNGTIVSSVNSKVLITSIPAGMSLYPANKKTAVSFFERSRVVNPPVSLWVNHKDRVYRDGDRLEVNIRPNVNSYIRAFYVMSDGAICQIFPTNERDGTFLKGGQVHTIGKKGDSIELFITDETKGQETIKVFASQNPIPSEFLPTQYTDGVDLACTDQGYKSLRKGVQNALNGNNGILPIEEINILIK